MRPLRLLAMLIQHRRILECERYGGTAGSGRCQHPEDHYPIWTFRWRLS